MATLKSFEELACWQASRELVKLVYQATNYGTLKSDFDTRSQFRRASLSIMNNIAEGFGRISNKEFLRFLDISQSSGREVKSMLYVLKDLEYLGEEDLLKINMQLDKTLALTLGLIRYLRKKESK